MTRRSEYDDFKDRVRVAEEEKDRLLHDNKLLMKVNEQVKQKVVEIEQRLERDGVQRSQRELAVQ